MATSRQGAIRLLVVLLLGVSFELCHGKPEDYSLKDEDAPTREQGNQLGETDAKGLPIYTTLNGSVTNLNEILPAIHLNRTKAYLNCSQGSMQVQLEFKEPFYGLAYADFDRNSACVTKGRGLNTAYIELPLKGCGTKQEPLRVFTNNIVVRFHPEFEIDGDEVITIVCRYPPAVALKPEPIYLPPAPPVPVTGPVLSPFHILLMICTLLFLALLLTGLGCSYICLRRRPVRIVERMAGSEITKISGSSALSRLSVFENFQIPRVHGTQQIYGSEAHLVVEPSDTLPSDYPSESHSEQGDEERSLPLSSAGSYETKALVHPQVEQRASSSLYSETINELESTRISQTRLQQQQQLLCETLETAAPRFEVQMRLKQRAPAPPSPLPSESEASLALERNLTTILEREESSRSMASFAYVPELHQPPPPMQPPMQPSSRQQTPPVYSRILRKQQAEAAVVESSDATHARYRVATMLAPSGSPPPPTPPQPSLLGHLSSSAVEQLREEVEPLVEPVVASRRPEITTHEVDDVFLRTVTEKKTIEDIERHRRQVTEYRARQQQQQQPTQPDPKWDVTIRNYPSQQLPPAPPDWENFSDVSSASNLTFGQQLEPPVSQPQVSKVQQRQPQPEPDQPLDDEHIQPTYTFGRSELIRGSTSIDERELEVGTHAGSEASGWHHLERVLEPQFASELTDDERIKWREIITTESTLRTLLTEAIVKEDYEHIRKDARYTALFPAAKWDVIIRIINPPANGSASSSSHGKSGQRYKRSKNSEWDNRSRRSSLPTLYEYESDGGSFGQDQFRQTAAAAAAAGALPGTRLRKLSSTTRGGSEADLRSMSEMTVRDFARLDRDDQTSLSSYEGESLVRSLSQPSLARSGSEFTEHWGVPARNLANWALDDEACSSTDTTPRALRRQLATGQTQGAMARSAAMYSEREVRVQSSSSSAVGANQRPSSWFHDDSEPEMHI